MTRKVKYSALAVILVLTTYLLACPGKAVAQPEDEEELFYGFNVSVSLGGAMPTTDEFGNSLFFRVGAGYEITPHLAVGIDVGRFSSEVDHGIDTPPGNTIADGDLKVTPLTFSLELRYPIPELYGTAYALTGLGYYFIDYSWNGGSRDYFAEVQALYGPAVQDVSDGVGFHLGGGFDYPLSVNMFLNLEGRYLILSPDASGSWRDLISGERHQFGGDINLNSWILSLGVKYIF